jgi:hypothetical protein
VALVVLLRGLNVGGHRRFRPSTLTAQLKRLDIVNLGATGTFVVRAPIAAAALRAEIARRLPFDAEIVICRGRDILRVLAGDWFAGYPPRPDVVRFVSVLSRAPRRSPLLPMTFPDRGTWLLKVLARDGRFVLGVYRRHMKVIGYLGGLDRLFGVPATTRGWTTVEAVGRVLSDDATPRQDTP